MRSLYEVKVSGKLVGYTEGDEEDQGRFNGGVLYGCGGVVNQIGIESPVIVQKYPNLDDEGFSYGPLHDKRPTVDGPEFLNDKEFNKKIEQVEKQYK